MILVKFCDKIKSLVLSVREVELVMLKPYIVVISQNNWSWSNITTKARGFHAEQNNIWKIKTFSKTGLQCCAVEMPFDTFKK